MLYLYLKGQGHTAHLTVKSTHACVSAIAYICSDGLLSNLVQLLWEVVQWPWPRSISQRSRSHKTF